jgi:hypothetical protein
MKNIEKIQKLLKMLSSPNDGEVVNAAHLLTHVLKEGGADIHELAARVEGLSEAEMKKLYDAGFRDGKKNTVATTTEFTDVGKPSFYSMACEIQHKANGQLSPKEQGFVDDMVRWCALREPSEKQAKWLHSIYCKIGRWS